MMRRVAWLTAKRGLSLPVVLFFVVMVMPARVEAQTVTDRVVARDESSAGPLQLRELMTGLEHPWAVAPLPDGGALVSERPGRLVYLSTVEAGNGNVVSVSGLPSIAAVGQGGLLDVVLAPDFEESRLVYFSYSRRQGLGLVTAVAGARFLSEGEPRLEGWREVFALNRPVAGGRHFGSRLAFDEARHLFITIGDRGQRDQAQDPGNHQGTVVRLEASGAVPEDNPNIPGAAPGVFSWGHRNAQGMALNPSTGEVWLHEHGPRGGDEINVVRRGANYGWPRLTYGVEYSGRPISESSSLPGYEDPLLHWTPSIAPSGMAFLESSRYPGWQGDLVVGALVLRHLRRIDLDGSAVRGQEELFSGFARFRDVRQGPDGYLYILTDEDPGGLYRLEPGGL